MHRVCLVVLALTFLAAPAHADNWFLAGPPGGTVRALAADPRDPRRVYLGTADGALFRSDDAGRTWRRTSPGFPLRGQSLDQVVVDTRGVVFVGYWTVAGKGGGVARSTDGGDTFRLLPGMRGESVRALAVAPSDARVIAAGSLTGVFLSRDGGDSWRRITPPGHADLRNVNSLAFDPAAPRTLYAGTWHLGWKTLDLGATWAPVHAGMIDDSDVMTLTVDRRDAGTIYATACTGVYRSSAAAPAWRRLPGIPEASRRTRAFAQDADDPDHLLAGTTKGLWKSDDGGAHWRLATPDQPVVNAVLSEPGGTILLGTEGDGVLRSEDGGRTWAVSNLGFSDRFVSRLLFDSPRHRVLAVETGGACVFAAATRGGPWSCLGAGLEGRHVLSLARLGATVYAGTDDGVFALRPEAEAWTRLPSRVDDRAEHLRVVDLLALAPHRLLAATSNGVIASTDGGATWTRPSPFGGDPAVALAAFPDDAARIVAATASGLFKSRDGGDTWEPVSAWPGGVTPHALAIVPADRPALLVTTTGGMFRSDDVGATWQRVGGLPHADLCALAVHPDGRTVYASDFHAGGIFRSTDGAATWERMSTGDLPTDRVWTIGLDPDAPDRIFVSSPSGLFVHAPSSAAIGD